MSTQLVFYAFLCLECFLIVFFNLFCLFMFCIVYYLYKRDCAMETISISHFWDNKVYLDLEELYLQFFTIATIFNIYLVILFCTMPYMTVSPESFDSCLLEHFSIIPVLFDKLFQIKFLRNLICDDFTFSLQTNCLISLRQKTILSLGRTPWMQNYT